MQQGAEQYQQMAEDQQLLSVSAGPTVSRPAAGPVTWDSKPYRATTVTIRPSQKPNAPDIPTVSWIPEMTYCWPSVQYDLMSESKRISRRRLLAITGSTTLVALAGCPDDDEPDDEPDNDEVEDVDVEEWADIEEFYFEGVVEHWTGIEPEIIEDEENPTITLIEGQEYDFRWVNGDGVVHNLEIRDEDDEIVDDYVSDDVGDEGEETTLEGVVATEEMTTYICAYHEGTQVGDNVVETE